MFLMSEQFVDDVFCWYDVPWTIKQLNSEKEIYMHAFKIFLEDLSYFL